jgi:hypothetical protein
VALLRPKRDRQAAIAVVDTKKGSKTYGKAVRKIELSQGWR